MMNIENLIWSAYRRNPCKLYSIRELALELKKSYPLIHQHLTRLLSQKKFLSKKVGKSILCYPNYHHPYTVLSLGLAEQREVQSASLDDVSLQVMAQFFSSQIIPGLMCAWSYQDELVLVIPSKECEASIHSIISSTTLQKKVRFITYDEKKDIVSALLQKEVVFFGFEQVHLLIRENYSSYASNFNVVSLDE